MIWQPVEVKQDMLSVLVQIVVTLACSYGTWLLVGPTIYLVVAGVVFLGVLGLMVDSNRRISEMMHENPERWGKPNDTWWYVWTTALSIGLGLFWPVLPFSFAWRRALTAVDTSRAAQTGEPGVAGVEDAQQNEDGHQARGRNSA